ncbi:MAG: hypothetical protein HC796_07200 [Synechococcaceae cyanobacterium RL_1_2]|nr:hypothetical protein [Synechococcaceae cyanobacterium RL_1_2]
MHKISLISLVALGSYLGNGPVFAQNATNDGNNNLSLPSRTDSFNPTFTPERQDVEFEDPQLLPSLDQLLRSPGESQIHCRRYQRIFLVKLKSKVLGYRAVIFFP